MNIEQRTTVQRRMIVNNICAAARYGDLPYRRAWRVIYSMWRAGAATRMDLSTLSVFAGTLPFRGR